MCYLKFTIMPTKQELDNSARRIPTPCPLGYLTKDNRMVFHHYLDLDIAQSVWGIALGGVVYAKCHQENGPYAYARVCVEHALPNINLPKVSDLAWVSFRISLFDETVAILQQNGISAEKWRKGWYWCREKLDENQIHIFDFRTRSYSVMSSDNSNGYIRLAMDV